MEILKVILENLLPVVVALVTPILLILAKKAIQAIEARYDLDVSATQEQAIYDALREGICWAEEKAQSRLKASSQPTSASAKLDAALDYTLGQIERLGLPAIARERLAQMLEARLFAERDKAQP
jgi:hypothetical protein